MGDGVKLSISQFETLQALIYLYVGLEHNEAAERGLKAILAIDPANEWALAMQAIVADSKGEYEAVIRFTDNLEPYDSEKKKALSFLRARAFMKLGDEVKARECLELNVVKE